METNNTFSNLLKNFDYPRIEPSMKYAEKLETGSNWLGDINREKKQLQELQKLANESTLKSEELLKQIAENTSYIKDLVMINRETQLNTEELTYVMKSIYKVSKAENKQEADSLFSQAIQVINDPGEAAGNIANLTSLLLGIYTFVSTII